MAPEITLDQWRALAAVVDHGGYARAAEALDKSQSTISHHIQRLEERLGTRVLRLEGRRAVLTDIGEVVLRRARFLLTEAGEIEQVARTLASGVEAEVHIAVDTIFPNRIILPAFQAFFSEFPHTRLELHETVITGIAERLRSGTIQIAITPRVPQGWIGDHLLNLEFVCVAHPDHPLHRLGRRVTEDDLRRHRQLVVRESDPRRETNPASLLSEQRLIVSTMGTRIQALCQGLGFAWSPRLKIIRELESGLLKPLPLERGQRRFAGLYIVLADPQGAGPATRTLERCIREQVDACRA
ncbi:MAG TPA: LysR family transcriptional regulator [Arenicellales bacterium]|nr:LysR family transcriptional regulator [Arenicellales bacterium]